MSDAPPGWDGLLDDGEEILWQGRPSGQVSFRGLEPGNVLTGLVMFGFAVFWISGAMRASIGDGNIFGIIFPLFGLPFLWVGFDKAGGKVLIDAYRRKRSWYTLTNRRAFIATEILGQRDRNSWPIHAGTVLDLEDGALQSIRFADRRKTARGQNRIGFELIPDGREVLGLMRQIQNHRGAS
ncbi:hypothetical protein CLV78_103197 [Aliiruegeria haliotis]|uniref:Aspartate carbamoyltransferase catalytic subunit n=1 Tax=Aliiruegeria haliotis TaxID=1280846 RepID=A0A2T0RT44_9RHOB|nr:aspartate carbamoyltransferase catalytic subunit [Aliiruegeria haliotis]PRY24331.1 hypothetical protein CLV78_103197 [Aliiruegeria haliotis]